MKKHLYIFALILWTVGTYGLNDSRKSDPNAVIAQLLMETRLINEKYAMLLSAKMYELEHVNQSLVLAYTTEQKVDYLIIKDRILGDIRKLQNENNFEISKVRYLKGLQVIRILYEKVLSLDHHFASVRTMNEINKMSNPNQYPEYDKLKEILKSKRDKKFAVDLTSMLGTNTLVSVVQTFTNMIGSTLTKDEKESEIKNVECILDFTLRMQNDLNTIYFETAYLQSSNDKIKTDIEALFRDYTKPIGYTHTLESCRKDDDWETI
ncbi:MAG: hypothetical protein EOO20_27915, partial [Chryseobacterium sp.]